MINTLFVFVTVATIVLGAALNEATAGVGIRPILKPGYKTPRYVVTGFGTGPIIVDRIRVERGTNERVNVTIYTGKEQKTLSSPSVEFEGGRLLPSSKLGIEWNGKSYSSAVFEKWKRKESLPGGTQQTPEQLQKALSIIFSADDKGKTDEHSELHGHIAHAHHHHDLSSQDDSRCKKETGERCEESQR